MQPPKKLRFTPIKKTDKIYPFPRLKKNNFKSFDKNDKHVQQLQNLTQCVPYIRYIPVPCFKVIGYDFSVSPSPFWLSISTAMISAMQNFSGFG